jgi:hypothetical protein
MMSRWPLAVLIKRAAAPRGARAGRDPTADVLLPSHADAPWILVDFGPTREPAPAAGTRRAPGRPSRRHLVS